MRRKPVLRDTSQDLEVADQPSHETDHRPLGNYVSRYTVGAWIQIVIELFVLLIYIGVAVAGVGTSIELSKQPTATLNNDFSYVISATMPWGAMFFSALAGGAIFATKWLYHSVAKAEWNRDRIIWRFIAPVNSAILATAAGFGISAGIMPFLDQNSFGNLYAALFFGFFIGHFSDNVLAALQRLARKWFGTSDYKGSEASRSDEVTPV
jgi:hypothetical protein